MLNYDATPTTARENAFRLPYSVDQILSAGDAMMRTGMTASRDGEVLYGITKEDALVRETKVERLAGGRIRVILPGCRQNYIQLGRALAQRPYYELENFKGYAELRNARAGVTRRCWVVTPQQHAAMKGAENPEAATGFMNWHVARVVRDDAGNEYNQRHQIVGRTRRVNQTKVESVPKWSILGMILDPSIDVEIRAVRPEAARREIRVGFEAELAYLSGKSKEFKARVGA